MGLAALVGMALLSGLAAAQTPVCDLQDYKSVDGVKAEANHDSVELTWAGEAGQQLRAQFTLRDGQPVVQELAARKSGRPVDCAWERFDAAVRGDDRPSAHLFD